MNSHAIRRAKLNDIDEIMQFIDLYWAKNHILAINRDIFLWQYQDEENLNIIIARDSITDEISAVLAYIKYGFQVSDDIMLALWKSNSKHSFLGMQLLQYLMEMGTSKISCNGINIKTTKSLYEFIGCRIGCLKHYYRLANREKYKIASIRNKNIIKCSNQQEYKLIPLETTKDFLEQFTFDIYQKYTNGPHKSKEFLQYRYWNHPTYHYNIYGIQNNIGIVNSIIFAREVFYNGNYILRIMDFIGNPEDLKFISYEIERLIQEKNYEYADFMQDGISSEVMNGMGFILNERNSGNMIPNYFEPFESRNVEVWYATQYGNEYIMCKADGDQDRPNKVESSILMKEKRNK